VKHSVITRFLLFKIAGKDFDARRRALCDFVLAIHVITIEAFIDWRFNVLNGLILNLGRNETRSLR
jgi:hypothetical protein